MKKLFSLLMALMLVMSLAVPASAASFTILGKDKFTFSPGSEYHETDLFGDGFKDIMPGDTVKQAITIKGEFKLIKEDSMKVTLQGIPHDPVVGPHYSEKAEQDDGKDADPDTGRDETVASMAEFLSVLHLKITNRNDGKVIFNDSADKIMKSVVLGQFRNKGSIVLDLELYWEPGDNDNDFANRVGEIDWQFTIEAYDDPAVADNPKTGDYIMMAVAIMAVSGVALAVLLICKKRKK